MSNINFAIARRYLFGKKSTNLINVITGISIFGISIGTAALILILSVFNGLEGLMTSLFDPYNPDLKVVPSEGKFLSIDNSDIKKISAIKGIVAASATIEEVCLFEYKGSQEIGSIKGVDNNYVNVTRIDTSIRYGNYKLKENNINYAVLDEGIRNKLAVNIDNSLTPVMAFMPLRKNKLAGAKEFTSKKFYPTGVFSKSNDDANQYIITSIDLARSLIQQEDMTSALEIKTSSDSNESYIKSEIQKILGTEVLVKNKYEQDEQTFKMIAIEKWIAFLITGLTLLLIAFNLVGALWMIVLDKKKDIAILRSIGYTKQKIRNLFFLLGILITLIGMGLGFFVGLVLYYIQRQYGMIGVPEGLLIDAYPVEVRMTDFIVVTIAVLIIGLLASILPCIKASKAKIELKT